MANRLRPFLLLALLPCLGALPPLAAARGFTFEPRWASRAAAAGDLDGDGTPDLVLAQSFLAFGAQHGRVVVLLGDPADPGHWRSRTELGVGANPHGLVLADLDGDGGLDIATADTNEGTVTVLLLHPASTTTFNFQATPGAFGIAAGDLDGDGLPDLAVSGGRDAVVLFQDPLAPGGFLAPVTVAAAVSPTSVAVADVDGAGGNDLVLGLADDDLGVLLQDAGTPGAFPSLSRIPSPGRDIETVVATDLDGDGRTDIACALRGLPRFGYGRGLGLLLQDPAGGMVFHSSVVDPDQALKTLEVVDMDADGTPDLLASGGGRVLWYRQDPANRGTFERSGHRFVDASEGGIAGADFDQDGLVDAAVAFSRPYLLLQNPGKPGKFLPPRRYRD